MKSIRINLIIGILLILSAFILGILTYSFTFKQYFKKEKSSEMQKIILDIENELSSHSLSDLYDYIYSVSEKYSVQIDIISIDS